MKRIRHTLLFIALIALALPVLLIAALVATLGTLVDELR